MNYYDFDLEVASRLYNPERAGLKITNARLNYLLTTRFKLSDKDADEAVELFTQVVDEKLQGLRRELIAKFWCAVLLLATVGGIAFLAFLAFLNDSPVVSTLS